MSPSSAISMRVVVALQADEREAQRQWNDRARRGLSASATVHTAPCPTGIDGSSDEGLGAEAAFDELVQPAHPAPASTRRPSPGRRSRPPVGCDSTMSGTSTSGAKSVVGSPSSPSSSGSVLPADAVARLNDVSVSRVGNEPSVSTSSTSVVRAMSPAADEVDVDREALARHRHVHVEVGRAVGHRPRVAGRRAAHDWLGSPSSTTVTSTPSSSINGDRRLGSRWDDGTDHNDDSTNGEAAAGLRGHDAGSVRIGTQTARAPSTIITTPTTAPIAADS